MIPQPRSEYTWQKLRLVIHLSVLISLLLSLYPFEPGNQIYAPDWLALVVLYWLLRNPNALGYWQVFFYGIAYDLLHFNFVGAESIGLLILSYFFLRYRMLFQFLPKIGQLVSIFLLLLIKQFCIQWILGIAGELPSLAVYLVPPLISSLAWLVLERLPLDNFRRRQRS